MKRACSIMLAIVFFALTLPTHSARAAALPKGIPAGAQEARIWGWIDGDSLKVRIGKKTEELQLIGVDAPELAQEQRAEECYAKEADEHIRSLVFKKQTVYLERDKDDRDGDGHLLRYLWVPGEGGAKAFLLNTKQIRDGYAVYDRMKPNVHYDTKLKTAVRDAKAKGRGLWTACGGAHEAVKLADQPAPQPPPGKQQQGFTPEERAYATTVGEEAFALEASFRRFADLMQNPRIGQDDWTIQIAAELVLWQQIYAAAQQLTPPPVFADIHAVWLQALGLYASAADDIANGIDYLDIDRIYAAAAKLDQATALVEQATQMLEEIKRERGVADRTSLPA
jgi:micrococcal nuclease